VYSGEKWSGTLAFPDELHFAELGLASATIGDKNIVKVSLIDYI